MNVNYVIRIILVGESSKGMLNVIDPIESIYTSKFSDFVKFYERVLCAWNDIVGISEVRLKK